MKGRPPILNDIQRADIRRRRESGEKLRVLALDFGVGLDTIRRACAGQTGGQESRDLGAALLLAEQAAALFGLTLADLQTVAAPGGRQIGDPVQHARQAAVAAMRVGDRPIAWEVVADVLAPGDTWGRLNLQRVLRRARAMGGVA